MDAYLHQIMIITDSLAAINNPLSDQEFIQQTCLVSIVKVSLTLQPILVGIWILMIFSPSLSCMSNAFFTCTSKHPPQFSTKHWPLIALHRLPPLAPPIGIAMAIQIMVIGWTIATINRGMVVVDRGVAVVDEGVVMTRGWLWHSTTIFHKSADFRLRYTSFRYIYFSLWTYRFYYSYCDCFY